MSEVTRLTILGCGSSGGVPRSNGDWGDCDPSEPKNRRRRCSALIEHARSRADLEVGDAVTRIVIDTSPDFREQMISAHVPRIDGVVYTHDHADQTHGIDDLRAFAYLQRQRIPVWMDEPTRKTLMARFGYTFSSPAGSVYPPILDARDMPEPLTPLEIDGPGGAITITPFDQAHGPIRSLGFLANNIAYSADISALPDDSAVLLSGVGCWVVDALRHEPHPTHFNVEDALAAIARIAAASAVLTNLHNVLDYQTLSRELPEGVIPAHDGCHVLSEDGQITL